MEGDIRSSSSELSDSSATANAKSSQNSAKNHSNHSSGTENHHKAVGGNGTSSHNSTPNKRSANKTKKAE